MRLAVIADDLTGALDASAPFARAGLTVVAPLGEHIPTLTWAPEVQDGGVLALNLETRLLSSDKAADRTALAARGLYRHEVPHWFKKLDSTLRGHWVEELVALRSAIEAPAVLVCPAFPAQGRMVEGGVVNVAGEAVGDCVAALRQQGGLRVEWLPVAASPAALAAALRERLGAGCDCVVADARTDADLDALVRAARRTGLDRLLCGSGGLAAAWARGMSTPPHDVPLVPAPRRILVAVGSRQAASRWQFATLCMDPVPSACAVALWLFSCPPVRDAREEDSQLADAMAEEAADYHRRTPFDALVLTGGQTAAAVLRRLAAHGLRVLREVEPGVPLSRVLGGDADGALCVTKAGGFGDDRTLLRVIDCLSTGGTARDVEPPPAGPDAG